MERGPVPPPHTRTHTFTMATLAALISSAINKVSTDPTYKEVDFETPQEAQASFTAALLYELGLGPMPVAAHAPVSAPTEEAPKKKRAAKKTEAPKEVEAITEQLGQLALEEQPAPKKVRKTKGNGSGEPVSSDSEPESAKEKKKPGPKPKKAAEPEPVKAPEPEPVKVEKKKPGPKPKAKVEGAINLEKLTPTHKKHLKTIAAELKVEPRDKEFLAYANDMSAEEWSVKPLDAHIRDFLLPEGAPALAAPPTEFLEVEFNGKEYLIDPTTKFIYTASASPTVKARSHVGAVGLLEFKDLEL